MAKKLKVGGKRTNVLSVEIGEETYSLPLAGSMKRKELLTLRNKDENEVEEALFDLFSKYIPAEVLDNLTMDEYGQIVSAWTDANEEATGESLGES